MDFYYMFIIQGEKMILVCDVGNTNMVLGVYKGEKL